MEYEAVDQPFLFRLCLLLPHIKMFDYENSDIDFTQSKQQSCV